MRFVPEENMICAQSQKCHATTVCDSEIAERPFVSHISLEHGTFTWPHTIGRGANEHSVHYALGAQDLCDVCMSCGRMPRAA